MIAELTRIGIAFALTGGATQGNAAWIDREESRLIFHSVLEGLYSDGVRDDVVDAVMDAGFEQTFVYACPLCHPVWEALRVYRSRPDFFGVKGHPDDMPDTFGDGLKIELREGLLSDDANVRREAVGELVTRYVDRRLTSMNLDDESRQEWYEKIQKARDDGMSMLNRDYPANAPARPQDGWEDCTICESAVVATKKTPLR